MRKHIILGIGALLLVGAGVVLFVRFYTQPETTQPNIASSTTPIPEVPPFTKSRTIGASTEGRPITVTQYGHGDTHVLFVGGMHGGYEWNSTLLAYTFMDYLTAHPEFVPDSVTISVIPAINPDGTFAVIGKDGRFAISDVPKDEGPVGTGRFTAHHVDLNRNFDCKWQPESTWRSQKVSAGTSPFSEPEAAALRDFIQQNPQDVVVFWHSQANAVYASECEHGVLPRTLQSMHAYADAAHYKAVVAFDAYPITGDAEGWLASIGIPAITVELSSHSSIEWERNLAGITALIQQITERTASTSAPATDTL